MCGAQRRPLYPDVLCLDDARLSTCARNKVLLSCCCPLFINMKQSPTTTLLKLPDQGIYVVIQIKICRNSIVKRVFFILSNEKETTLCNCQNIIAY